MDIAAFSIMSSQMNVANQASILVLKQAMNTSAQQSDGLLQVMNAGSASISPPNLGNNIDISV